MLPKIIYDRLWNRKNYFKVLALLPNERRKSRIGKIKAMKKDFELGVISKGQKTYLL